MSDSLEATGPSSDQGTPAMLDARSSVGQGMEVSELAPEAGQHGGAMHTELKLVDAAAFSVGLIGPVGAIALLGTGAAPIIGRAVTLSFVFAVIGVALVAFCFIKLSQNIAHTGSVYALCGVTLGPRAGFFAGWALMGGYIAIGCGSTIEIGLFAGQFLHGTGILTTHQWWWIALVGLAGVCALAFNEIQLITRSLLASEVAGAVLVTVLSLVVLATVIFSHGPGGQTFTGNFLVPPSGSGIGKIAHAAVYAFLAFAGFEGAAALGEETSSPKTEIPRAIKVAVVVVGSFYLLTAASQSLGYGATAAGAKAYAAGLPFTDLGSGYIGKWYADVLNLMATISLFAITLGVASGGARIMFAQARDATGKKTGLAGLSKHGAPAAALGVVFIIIFFNIVGQQLAGTTVNATFYALQIGTVILLVAYVLVTAGTIRYLFFTGEAKAPRWQIVIPALGGAFVIYTIIRKVFVGQVGTYAHLPYIELGWLLLGLGVVCVAPGLAGRVKVGLAASEAA